MKRLLVPVFLAVLAFCFVAPHAVAAGSPDAAVLKECQAFMDAVAAMLDKKDLDAVVKTCVPGTTLRYANGVVTTIEEWATAAEKELAGLENFKSKFKVESVISAEDRRFFTYTETHNYSLSGEKKHRYRSVSRWSVTMVKTPQGWKAVHFLEFSEKNTRDGKPIKPSSVPKAT